MLSAGRSFFFPVSCLLGWTFLLRWVSVREKLSRCRADRVGEGFLDFRRPTQTLANKRDRRTQHFKLAGDLTIRDTTKRIVLDVTYLGEATDPWGGARIAFEAKGTINRTDFGLVWNQVLEAGGLLVGEEVELELEIQAVQQ